MQETVSGLQQKDRVIKSGGFNAKVENRREEWREVIGGSGEEARNDNGRKMVGGTKALCHEWADCMQQMVTT